jgi:endonuclease YncB( thermonuclease family)
MSSATALRRHLIWIWTFRALGGIALGTMIGDHLVWKGDDWNRFSHQTVLCQSVIDGQTIQIDRNGTPAAVRLLGIAGCDAKWDKTAQGELNKQFVGRKLILQLEKTQTRDADRCLLAYVYCDDRITINAQMVHDGLALADRRVTGELSGSIAQAETEARKKHRGLWAANQETQLPQWRQDWSERQRAREAKLLAAANP